MNSISAAVYDGMVSSAAACGAASATGAGCLYAPRFGFAHAAAKAAQRAIVENDCLIAKTITLRGVARTSVGASERICDARRSREYSFNSPASTLGDVHSSVRRDETHQRPAGSEL